jgi:glycosyltransferase involved in cell wall biosynthesis
MWKNIKEILPGAVLNVYCDLDHEWTNKVAPEMMREIKETIHQEQVVLHGWVSKLSLMDAWNKTDYWLYPCIFEETFCLTALEAAISKTRVITNGLAGLAETAKYGITIPGDPMTQEWQNKILEQLKSEAVIYPDSLLEQNYSFAKSLSWKNQTDKLINFVDYDNKVVC